MRTILFIIITSFSLLFGTKSITVYASDLINYISPVTTYCLTYPRTIFNCEKIRCERQNAIATRNSINNVNDTTDRVAFMNCEHYQQGIDLPIFISSTFIGDILFSILLKYPSVETYILPTIICFVCLVFLTGGYLYWKKRK